LSIVHKDIFLLGLKICYLDIQPFSNLYGGKLKGESNLSQAIINKVKKMDTGENNCLIKNINEFLCRKIISERLKFDSTQEFYLHHFDKIKSQNETETIEKCKKKIRKIVFRKMFSKSFTQDSLNQTNEYFQNKAKKTNETSAQIITSASSSSAANSTKKTALTNFSNACKTRVNYLKQKRAKRGQYRKYESEQLERAVDVVLSGLMSVHKAGLCFGVPHSTLEYKVKEKTIMNENYLSNKFTFAGQNLVNENLNPLNASLGQIWSNNQTSGFGAIFDGE
jgi:hypothetical protein